MINGIFGYQIAGQNLFSGSEELFSSFIIFKRISRPTSFSCPISLSLIKFIILKYLLAHLNRSEKGQNSKSDHLVS